MAEAALQETEELEVPTGGIGDFVMEDDEADKVYADTDTKESFGDDGIAQFPALAERMAKYGRNEDNMLAHVAEGELVIPAQFLKDEVMKQRIFGILGEMGVEDPQAYVVGAEANDINPTTGLPEFFLKKLFKSVVKGVKSVVKSVVKVVKKVAPMVLPIALSATPLGPVFGAALGSGIGTLIQGGSIGDALKSGLMAGAVGAATAGFTGQGSFMENVMGATSNFGDRFSQTVSGFTDGVSSGSLGGFTDSFFKSYTPAAELAQATQAASIGQDAANVANVSFEKPASAATGTQLSFDPSVSNAQPVSSDFSNVSFGGQSGSPVTPVTPAEITPVAAASSPSTTTLQKPMSFGESIKAAFDPSDNVSMGQGLSEAFFPRSVSTTEVLTSQGIDPSKATPAEIARAETIAKDMNPSLLRKYGPLAAGAGLAAYGMGFFDTPEVEQASFLETAEDGQPLKGTDLIERQPGDYLVKNLGTLQLDEATGQYRPIPPIPVPPAYRRPIYRPIQRPPDSTPGGPFARPYVMQAADGGPVFPRRTGGIAPTEGVPGQDSVKAMLMPGEFVMTTDAVRGLGNGDLNNGIQNMYSVMRNLERRGRAKA